MPSVSEATTLNLISPALAQTEAPHEAPAAHDPVMEVTGEHAVEHHTFPPFDPATFGSQLFWLAILFGLLYIVMSRLALPKVGAILAERDNRIARDLAEAARMKEASDAAVAAYQEALAVARLNAHTIAQKAGDEGKAALAAERTRLEAELNARLAAAEVEIANVKNQALAGVDAIARDAVEAIVEALVGTKVEKHQVASAVQAAMAGGA